MNARRRRLLLGAAGAATAAGLLAGPLIGRYAASERDWLYDARFAEPSGAWRRLADWPAEVLALNFWATWCTPCRDELPLLMAARERFRARGVEVIGMAIDLAANVAAYTKVLPITFPVLIAEPGGLRLMRSLGNAGGALPFTALVDARGGLLASKLGAFEATELDRALAQALSKS